MHVIERTDDVHARRRRRAAREADALRRRGAARARAARARRAARPVARRGARNASAPGAEAPPATRTSSCRRGSRSCSSRRRRRSRSTSTTSRSPAPIPRRVPSGGSSSASRASRRGRRGASGSRSAARSSSCAASEREATERPLLNHLAVLVDSADEWRQTAEDSGHEIAEVKDAREHVRRVRLGARARQAGVRRAQAELLARVRSHTSPARGWRGSPPPRACASSASRRASSRRATVRAGRCSSRAGSCGATAASSSSASSAPRATSGCSGSSTSGSTRRSTGSRGSGAPVLARETGNPLTVGRRFDPHGLTDALVRAAGGVELGAPLPDGDGPLDPRDRRLPGRSRARRAAHRAGGTPARAREPVVGRRRAAARDSRAAPRSRRRSTSSSAARCPLVDTIAPEDFVRAAQLYGRHAHVVDLAGEPLGVEPAWAELDLVQAIAHRPGGRAWYILDARGARAARCASGRSRTWSRSPRSSARRYGREPRRARGAARVRGRRGAARGAAVRRVRSRPGSRTRSAGSRSTSRRASSTRRASRSRTSTPRASTRAASPAAATRAGSRRRSSSASSPRRASLRGLREGAGALVARERRRARPS